MTTLPWWIEVKTEEPKCTYYFGPFNTKREAETARFDYTYDLYLEKATGFSYDISQNQPKELTIFDE